MANIYTEKNLSYLGALVIFLLPTYLIRFSIFGMGTNVLDIGMLAFLIISIPTFAKKYTPQDVFRFFRKKVKKPLFIGIFFLLLGLFLSSAQEGFSEGELGIIKSWFILPITFSGVYFVLFPAERERGRLFWAHIWSAVFVSVGAFGYFLFGEMTYDGRLRAFYESPNQLVMYLAPAVLLIWFLAYKDMQKKIILLVPVLLALYLTFSYGAWIAVIVSIMVSEYIFRFQKLVHIKFFVVCIGICAVLFSMQLTSQKFQHLVSLDDRSSLASRAMIWRSAWDIGKDNWFLGIGPGNFQEKYLEYQQFYPPYLEWAVPQPHNLYLAFWLETGILGFIGFVVVIAATLEKLWKYKNTAILLDVAVFGALFVILLHGLVDTPYWKNDLSVVFWMLVVYGVKTR